MTCCSPISSGSYGPPYQSSAALRLLFCLLGDIVQELVITGNAGAILRRASPLPAEELRIQRSRFGSFEFLDNDPVLPIVAHIVDIIELSYADGQKRR